MVAFLTPMPNQQFLDLNGNPLAGGQLFSYVAGTSTPKALFDSQAATVPLPNPAILDAAGRLEYWLDTSTSLYRLELQDALNNVIWDVDNVGGMVTGTEAVTQPVVATGGVPTLAATGLVPINTLTTGALIHITTSFGTSGGLTGLSVGVNDDPEIYAVNLALVATTQSTPGNYRNYRAIPNPAARDIIITAEGGNFDAIGALIVTALYEIHVAQTS